MFRRLRRNKTCRVLVAMTSAGVVQCEQTLDADGRCPIHHDKTGR